MNSALTAGDLDGVLVLMRDAVRRKGTTHVARDVGLDRVNIYRMLAHGKSPRIGSMMKVLEALGFRFELAAAASPRHELDGTDPGVGCRSPSSDRDLDTASGRWTAAIGKDPQCRNPAK